MKVESLLKVDYRLLTVQSKIISLILLGILIANSLEFQIYREKIEKNHLKININKADLEALQKLPYIGRERAELIIQIRESKGYFISVEELKFLPYFDKIKPYIKLED